MWHTCNPNEHKDNADELYRDFQKLEGLYNSILNFSRQTDAEIGNKVQAPNDVADLLDELKRQFYRSLCSELLINEGFEGNEIRICYDGVIPLSIVIDEEHRQIAEQSEYLTIDDEHEGVLDCAVDIRQYRKERY